MEKLAASIFRLKGYAKWGKMIAVYVLPSLHHHFYPYSLLFFPEDGDNRHPIPVDSNLVLSYLSE
jgi:hypothetical protein